MIGASALGNEGGGVGGRAPRRRPRYLTRLRLAFSSRSLGRPPSEPARYATALALAYLLFGVSYIAVGTSFERRFADSMLLLRRIEAAKGVAFMFLSATMLYFFSRALFRRIGEGAGRLRRIQNALAQSERDAVPGLLMSSLAHDFGNTLTLFRAGLETLREPNADARRELVAERLERGVARLDELASRMQAAGKRALAAKPVAFDFHQAVEESLGFVHLDGRMQGPRFEARAEGEGAFFGYPVLVHQILLNLALNAAEAAGPEGRVLVVSRRLADGSMELDVHDDGPGAVEPERIFDPFFTTKARGSGLGLASVRSCARLHGGDVTVGVSDALGGALFAVRLRSAAPEGL